MDFNKIKLFINTIIYLRPIQVYYRLYYFLRNRLFGYNVKKKNIYDFNPIVWENRFDYENSYFKKENSFTFLNISHFFSDKINWNFNQFGKLWTYNLNYFDFLNQENISKEIGLRLIQDFIKNEDLLKDGKEPYPISLRGINWVKFFSNNQVKNELINNKKQRKFLLTIDDGFLSFYNNAWPILKKNKIPFILFVSTREVGSFNYMNWDQIKEIAKEDFVEIGNHSHTHEYLVNENDETIKADIKKSINLFKTKLGKNSIFFSYPFGEYSISFKNIIISLGFKYAFGQHSGLIDETKNFYELPRFPINEKYGEIKRFTSLTKTLPFKYKNIFPEEKYILDSKNPPQVKIEFYENIKNLNSVNCYSNEDNKWRKSEIAFISNNVLQIYIKDKFVGERGRINCSLRDPSGFWRWLGIQFVLSEKN